jgi:hypothetical protein
LEEQCDKIVSSAMTKVQQGQWVVLVWSLHIAFLEGGEGGGGGGCAASLFSLDYPFAAFLCLFSLRF